MNLSGRDRQTIHECLVAAWIRPPWAGSSCAGRIVADLVESWPQCTLDPETRALVGEALRVCARAREPADWDDFLSVTQAEVADLEKRWRKVEHGEALPHVPPEERSADPRALYEHSTRYDGRHLPEMAQVFRIRALDAAREEGDDTTAGLCLTGMAFHDLGLGNPEAGLRQSREAVALLRAANEPRGLGVALLTHAHALRWNEQPVDVELAKEALELLLTADFAYDAAECLLILAEIEPEAARAHLERAVPLFDDSPSILGAPRALRKLATFELEHGDPRSGVGALEGALERLGDKLGRPPRLEEASCLEVLGDTYRVLEDGSRSRAAYEQSLEVLERFGDRQAERVRAKLTGSPEPR